MQIRYDYSFQLSDQIGERGISSTVFEDMLTGHEGLWETIQSKKDAGEFGFAQLPYQTEETLAEIEQLADHIKNRFKSVLVVGIGGSDLGARAVHRALNHQFYNLRGGNPKLFFVGDTTDPEALQEVLDVVSLMETCIIVISKSGNTVEQMSTFVYLRDQLEKQLGELEAREHIVLVTDPEKGTLRALVQSKGYKSLAVPPAVGGRFSVLSSVGLLPLAIVGVDIRGLLAGAQEVDAADKVLTPMSNPMLQFAVLQHWHYLQGRPISVLMPYQYRLREVGFWFRQLWAESLGKHLAADGKTVLDIGPTPIAAVGPTDQHSQVQLYMEGPADKVFTFIRTETSHVNLHLPESLTDQEGMGYLKGRSFTDILHAEQEATALALARSGKPSGCLILPELTAETLGEVLYFFELTTLYAGELFGVNAFDQPGVELGKQYKYGLLGKEGFADPRKG